MEVQQLSLSQPHPKALAFQDLAGCGIDCLETRLSEWIGAWPYLRLIQKCSPFRNWWDAELTNDVIGTQLPFKGLLLWSLFSFPPLSLPLSPSSSGSWGWGWAWACHSRAGRKRLYWFGVGRQSLCLSGKYSVRCALCGCGPGCSRAGSPTAPNADQCQAGASA